MDHLRSDALDQQIGAELSAHRIPGLSLAVIKDSRLLETRVYGTSDGVAPITPETLFQAGSISKVVTAAVALILVEQGLFSLDENVNSRLKEWQVPENAFTLAKKVTVRRILSHSAGFSVHGFAGYPRDAVLPRLGQILDGVPPANNQPIRITSTPDTAWRYSGGGYVVLQALITDVTSARFEDVARDKVLTPLQMAHSTFTQPLPAPLEASAACGHYHGGALTGKWHVYPELAAAGLWTTPSDLARLACALQQGKAAASGSVLSATVVQEMLTPVLNHDGLGLFLSGPDDEIFGHDGRNFGYDSNLRASASDGVVVMINDNDDSGALNRIVHLVWDNLALRPALP